ncbi:hypothetical protein NFHSH190041_28600 [Shewanella sp. NFH-SH190041]|nr:hypothetical protein NFHSH190041_28600 [Shewanella sp. NFH-SH190041]
MPLPNDETTPPVTKIYLVVMLNLRKMKVKYSVLVRKHQDGATVY